MQHNPIAFDVVTLFRYPWYTEEVTGYIADESSIHHYHFKLANILNVPALSSTMHKQAYDGKWRRYKEICDAL